jgi:hypothetical protein
VLVFTRTYEDETMLVIANLSRFRNPSNWIWTNTKGTSRWRFSVKTNFLE